jgi:predicted transcriptional regulator
MAQEINGTPVTEATIKRLAAEAERGYPVEQLKKRGRRPAGDGPGKVVTVRLDATLRHAIEERSRRDKKNESEVIRDAVRAWL